MLGHKIEGGEPDDPLDHPKYGAIQKMEDEKYWQELDDRQRWAE